MSETNGNEWPVGSSPLARSIREAGAEGFRSLGPPGEWPSELRTSIDIIDRLPMPGYLWWGPEFLQFCNEPAHALGRCGPLATPAHALWGDVWDQVAAIADRVRSTASGLQLKASAIPIHPAAWSVSPVPDRRGGVAGVLLITLPAPAPSTQRASQFGEFAHRTRNVLATIRSVVRRTGRGNDAVAAYADHLDGRIAVLTRIHTALSRDVPPSLDLATLVADTLLAAQAGKTKGVHVEGPSVALNAEATETLGLALHELATNAIKFGALSPRGGRLSISWEIDRTPGTPAALELCWHEGGLEDVAPEPWRSGFGTEVILRTLTYELDARSHRRVGADNVSYRINIPLARVTEIPPVPTSS